jgi:transcriptional regulator with XRE-family HTH domain
MIAERLRQLRAERGWTLDQLAQASGVSRGMISKIERHESSATAALLSRLAHALAIPLSDLLSRPRPRAATSRKAERARWQDPQTGFTREVVSPTMTSSAVEIVEVELPAGAKVAYQLPAPAAYHQHLLVLAGTLRIHQDGAMDLQSGDAFFMEPSGAFSFENVGARSCRYLLVMERKGP